METNTARHIRKPKELKKYSPSITVCISLKIKIFLIKFKNKSLRLTHFRLLKSCVSINDKLFAKETSIKSDKTQSRCRQRQHKAS